MDFESCALGKLHGTKYVQLRWDSFARIPIIWIFKYLSNILTCLLLPSSIRNLEKIKHGSPPRSPPGCPEPSALRHGDGRPFLPFRQPDKQPAEPNRPPYRGDIINALKDFEFSNISHKSVTDLTKLLSKYHKQNHPSIPFGYFGIIDYGFAPQTLAPGSLNPENAAAPRDASSRDLLQKLHFVNAKDRDGGAPRLALVLGRLTAQHFNPERVSQSHWIVFLDQMRMLWACYAYDIDNEDITLDKPDNPGPYHASCDTAFGAKKDQGQKVVFLGALKDITFKVKEELNAEAHDLGWSTSALSENMILEMKKQDLLLATREEEGKDEDATEDAEVKESGSKKGKTKKLWNALKDAKKRKDRVKKDRENKENDEEKLYGTREPTDPKHAAKKGNLEKEDNGKQESLDTENSIAKDVDTEDLPLCSAESDVLPDADFTPGHGSVED